MASSVYFEPRFEQTADMGELVVKSLEMAIDTGGRNAGDPHVAAQRTGALAEIAETYLSHPENSGSTADRYQVVIHTRGSRPPDSSQLENHSTCHAARIKDTRRRLLPTRTGHSLSIS